MKARTEDGGRWRLLVWALAGLVVLIAVYWVAVRLQFGQRVDFSAFEGRKWTALWARRRVARVVLVLTPLAVVAVTGWSVVIAARFRGWSAAVVVGAAPAAVIPIARVLKDALPREELLDGSWISATNGYPSGHAAALTAAALGAVTVSPPHLRPRVAVVAVAASAGHMLAMFGSGWHRPSDLVGGLGLAVLVSALAAWVAAPRWSSRPEAVPVPWYTRTDAVGACLAAVGAVSLSWLVLIRLAGSPNYGSFALHALLAVCATGMVAASVVIHSVLVTAADVACTDELGAQPEPDG